MGSSQAPSQYSSTHPQRVATAIKVNAVDMHGQPLLLPRYIIVYNDRPLASHPFLRCMKQFEDCAMFQPSPYICFGTGTTSLKIQYMMMREMLFN